MTPEAPAGAGPHAAPGAAAPVTEAHAAGAPRRRRGRAAWVSLAGAVLILGLKFSAYLATGSVGFLSDAAESLVNLVAAVVLLVALGVSVAPPDYRHPYGHAKAEYLSSVLEAALIIVAAGAIAWSAVGRLLAPEALTNVPLGVGVSVLAAVLNGLLAVYLFSVARRERSDALAANARHILTDVYTSLGVVVGVLLVALTGWQPLDPLVALVVAANIVVVGVRVMRQALSRLLDERLPEREEAKILAVLEADRRVLGFHRLRTRRSGHASFAEVDLFVDPKLTVKEAHDLVGMVEDAIHAELEDLVVTIHVEPFVQGVRDRTLTPKEEFKEEVENG